MKVFLYGRRQSGKSTIIKKLLSELSLKPSGFLTVSDSGDYSGCWNLHILSAAGGDMPAEGNRAACCYADGSWKSFNEVFDKAGVKLLTFDNKPQIVVMDEIGFMEAGAVRFQRRVLEILDSNYNVIGAIKPVRNEFMLSVLSRPGVKTLEVTENSRDKIFRELAEMYYYEQRYNKDL